MEALHLGCVGLAAAGACCTAAARTPTLPLDVVGALLMVLAMTDTALHLTPIPAAGWALLLVANALTTAILHSPSRDRNQLRPHNVMIVHRNIGAILMAALLVIMDAHQGVTSTGGHGGHAGNLLVPALIMGAAGYTVASIWMIARRDRTPSVHRVESGLMGLSVLLMAVGGTL